MPTDALKPTPFLNQWGGFIAVASALTLGFATSSLPTPLYPLYQTHWGLQPSGLTYIYALYMGGVLLALLFLGRLSDAIGRYAVLCISLVLMTVGLLMSGVASGINTLLVARGIIGAANGLMTTAGALALVDAHPSNDRRVASVTTSAAIAVGVGLGPLLSGLMAQTGFAPLRLSYFVVSLMTLGNLWLAWRCRHTLRKHTGNRARLSISPKLALPDRSTRTPFLLASAASFTMFAGGSLFASLIPSYLYDLFPFTGPIVPGLAFLIMAAGSAITQFSQRDINPVKGLKLGLTMLMLFLISLMIGIWTDSAAAFIAAVIFAGVGQGLCFMAATMLAGLNSDETRRSSNMATYFAIAYIGAAVPVMALGWMADLLGVTPAVLGFCALTVVALASLLYQVRKHLPQ